MFDRNNNDTELHIWILDFQGVFRYRVSDRLSQTKVETIWIFWRKFYTNDDFGTCKESTSCHVDLEHVERILWRIDRRDANVRWGKWINAKRKSTNTSAII